MKKTTAFVLAVLMVLSLGACGVTGADKSMLGTYRLYAMDYDEDTIIFADELFEGENYVTIQSGGKAEMCLEDDKANVTWKADGDKLRFTAADGDMEGSLKDGVLTLVFDGTNLYFVGENASTASIKAHTLEEIVNGVDDPSVEDPEEPVLDAPAEETEVQKMWNGWWYGCIDISGSEGGWEYANGLTFDAAMQVELDEDGSGKLIIFDPYGAFAVNPDHQNRYVVIDCHADSMYLYGDSGVAFDYDINPSDWRVVHNLDNPDKIHVGSSYTDDSGNKLGYDFTFLPWGDRWENETYQQFIPRFDDYLAMLDAGMTSPYDDGSGAEAVDAPSNGGSDNGGSAGGNSELLGSNPVRLDVNDRGIVYLSYPGDLFRYDADYGKLKNDDTGVGILIDPMLGSTNFDELKASYEANNSDEDDYSLTETTILGYKALIMTYSDWLGSTMRVDIDFGGNHDGWYGISFSVSGDSLDDCDTDLIWAIIESMELLK